MRSLIILATLIPLAANAQQRVEWYQKTDNGACRATRLNPATIQRQAERQGKPAIIKPVEGGVVVVPESNSGGAAFEPVFLYSNLTGCERAGAQ